MNVRRYTYTACPVITLKTLHATDYPIPSTNNDKMRACHLLSTIYQIYTKPATLQQG